MTFFLSPALARNDAACNARLSWSRRSFLNHMREFLVMMGGGASFFTMGDAASFARFANAAAPTLRMPGLGAVRTVPGFEAPEAEALGADTAFDDPVDVVAATRL